MIKVGFGTRPVVCRPYMHRCCAVLSCLVYKHHWGGGEFWVPEEMAVIRGVGLPAVVESSASHSLGSPLEVLMCLSQEQWALSEQVVIHLSLGWKRAGELFEAAPV